MRLHAAWSELRRQKQRRDNRSFTAATHHEESPGTFPSATSSLISREAQPAAADAYRFCRELHSVRGIYAGTQPGPGGEERLR
jgi:hypothetical protein